jgi:hypothetical protein
MLEIPVVPTVDGAPGEGCSKKSIGVSITEKEWRTLLRRFDPSVTAFDNRVKCPLCEYAEQRREELPYPACGRCCYCPIGQTLLFGANADQISDEHTSWTRCYQWMLPDWKRAVDRADTPDMYEPGDDYRKMVQEHLRKAPRLENAEPRKKVMLPECMHYGAGE